MFLSAEQWLQNYEPRITGDVDRAVAPLKSNNDRLSLAIIIIIIINMFYMCICFNITSHFLVVILLLVCMMA